MAKFKKVDDLIGAFLNFDILGDEMPVATTDDEGNAVVMTRDEYAAFLERKRAPAVLVEDDVEIMNDE